MHSIIFQQVLSCHLQYQSIVELVMPSKVLFSHRTSSLIYSIVQSDQKTKWICSRLKMYLIEFLIPFFVILGLLFLSVLLTICFILKLSPSMLRAPMKPKFVRYFCLPAQVGKLVLLQTLISFIFDFRWTQYNE